MPRQTPLAVDPTSSLIEQLRQVAQGLGATFAPFCEVVVHDLRDPRHAIVAIENNLSGRGVGGPATELGLARISDPGVDQVLANYPGRLADGRPVKCTSIGIRDARGDYVAALCLNVDLTLFQGLQNTLAQFTRLGGRPVDESLAPANADAIRRRIDRFAAALATTPRMLATQDRRQLVRELKASGAMDVRRSVDIVSRHLGVSRATVYSDTR